MKTKKEPKIVRAARLAKSKGYQYLSSIVYQCFYSSYMHFVDIDEIIKAQKWIPHKRGNGGTLHPPAGTLWRQKAFEMLEEEEEKEENKDDGK